MGYNENDDFDHDVNDTNNDDHDVNDTNENDNDNNENDDAFIWPALYDAKVGNNENDNDENYDSDDNDIYIMMKCMSVCLSRFCLFCLPPAKLTIYI